MSCAALGCVNNRRFRPEGISFHTFPRNELLPKWLNILGKDPETWTWSRNKVVCSKHFKNEDFIIRGGNKTLKVDAVPFIENLVDKSQPSTSIGPKSEISSESSIDLSKSLSLKEEPIKWDVDESEKSDCSTSSDSSTKRRQTVEFISKIHSYSISPQKMKMRQIQLIRQQRIYRRRLYSAKKKITDLKKEIASLKNVITGLKKQNSISNQALDHKIFIPIQFKDLILRFDHKDTALRDTVVQKKINK